MLRGHKTTKDKKGNSIYVDTQESTVENWKTRPCGVCSKHFTPEGHDACLGTLTGVKNACCGHGIVNRAYIQLDHEDYEIEPNKYTYKGKEAIEIQQKLKSLNP